MKLTYKNNQLCLSFPYDSLLVQLVRQFENRRWDSINKTWNFPITDKNLEYLKDKWFTVIYDNQSKKAIADYHLSKTAVSVSAKTIQNIEIYNLKGKLFNFQKEGVAFLNRTTNTKGSLLADDMGCISGEAEIIINRGEIGRAHV